MCRARVTTLGPAVWSCVFKLLFRQGLADSGLLLAAIAVCAVEEIRHDADCARVHGLSELSNEAIRGARAHTRGYRGRTGQELLKATGGIAEIQRILEENLEVAVSAGEEDKINDRKRVLGRFIASYSK